MNMFEDITWQCHICKQTRPDDKISVRQHPLVSDGVVLGEQNIRYCNDNSECIEASKTFTFLDYEI